MEKESRTLFGHQTPAMEHLSEQLENFLRK